VNVCVRGWVGGWVGGSLTHPTRTHILHSPYHHLCIMGRALRNKCIKDDLAAGAGKRQHLKTLTCAMQMQCDQKDWFRINARFALSRAHSAWHRAEVHRHEHNNTRTHAQTNINRHIITHKHTHTHIHTYIHNASFLFLYFFLCIWSSVFLTYYLSRASLYDGNACGCAHLSAAYGFVFVQSMEPDIAEGKAIADNIFRSRSGRISKQRDLGDIEFLCRDDKIRRAECFEAITYKNAYTHASTHTSTHALTHTPTPALSLSHIHAYLRARIHSHTRVHTKTHK